MNPKNQWEDIESRRAREQAMDNIITNTMTDPLTSATNQFKQSSENPFEQRQQFYSKYSLLDENLKPIQTYTAWRQQNPTAPPVQDQDTFMFLDKRDEYKEMLNNNQITENQYLRDLYQIDILKENGYDIRNVGWWEQKYNNHDFTNPLEDPYLQQQVLQAARERENYYSQLEYAHTKKITESQMTTYLGKGDLSNKDIATLFPELTSYIKDTYNTQNYEEFITSGQISAQDRIYHTDTQSYYLHTDGHLYLLDNQSSGSNVAHYQTDSKGNIISIDLNDGNELITTARSFTKGMADIPKMFVQLAAVIVSPFTYITESGSTNFLEHISNSTSEVGGWFNDVGGLLDSGYVDLNGKTEGWEWAYTISESLGMMTGGVLLGGGFGKIAAWGDDLMKHGHKTTGWLLKQTGLLYSRSTGNFKNPLQAAQDLTTKEGIKQSIKSAKVLGSWLDHSKTVGVYMFKDFYNNINQLYSDHAQMNYQRYKEGKDQFTLDHTEIFKMAATNAAVNGAISMILSGGIDDNQLDRWGSLFKNKAQVTDNLDLNIFFRASANPYLRVGINTAADFLDNALTMYTGNIMGYNTETGSIEWNEKARIDTDDDGEKDTINWNLAIRTAVQAGIMTLPTLRANIEYRNIAGEKAEAWYQATLNELYKGEADTTNPKAKQSYMLVRKQLLENFQKPLDTNGKPIENPTIADRSLYALSKLDEGLRTGDSNMSPLVKRTMKETLDPAMINIYKEMNSMANDVYRNRINTYNEKMKDAKRHGIRTLFTGAYRKFFGDKYRNAKAYEQSIANGEAYGRALYDQYLFMTGSIESQTVEDRIRARIDFAEKILTDAEEDITLYKQMKRKDKSQAKKAAEAKAKEYNTTTENILAASQFVRLKNESPDRKGYNSSRATFNILVDIMPDLFYKVDDNTFGMIAPANKMGQLFTMDVQQKVNLAVNILSGRVVTSDQYDMKIEALDLLVKTLEGDGANLSKQDTKDLLEQVFAHTIESGAMDKLEVAELLMAIETKYGDEEGSIGNKLRNAFTTELSLKNVKKADSLTDIEKYTLLYATIKQLSTNETNRFSSKTIAAEMMASKKITDLEAEVIADMESHKIPIDPNAYTKYVLLQAEKIKEGSFQYATDRLSKDFKDMIEVIGQDGYANLKKMDDEAGESFLVKELKKLANYKGKEDSFIHTRAKELLEFFREVEKFTPVKFTGDVVTIDMARWVHSEVSDAAKEVARQDDASAMTMDKKKSWDRQASEKATIKQLDHQLEVAKHKTLTIKLEDSNMEEITWLYNMLVEAEYIPADFTRAPKNAEDMKNILKNSLSEEGQSFAVYKSTYEYDTGIISKEAAKQIKEKLKDLSVEDIVYNVRVLDPNNDIVARYDYYQMLSSNIHINKISSKMQKHMMRNNDAPIYLNPVDLSSFNTDSDGVGIFIRRKTNKGSKSGRSGGQAGQEQTYTTLNDTAKIANANHDIAKSLMICDYIDFVLENAKHGYIAIPIRHKQQLYNLDILGQDGFYEERPSKGVKDGYFTIGLKPWVTKEDMEYYILSSDVPNLFKILPFASDDAAQATTVFQNPEMHKLEFVPDISGGLTTDNRSLYGFANKMFNYDQKQVLRTELINGLFLAAKDGHFSYNPFSKDRLKLVFENQEDFHEYRELDFLDPETNDPYAILVDSYKQLQEEFVDDTNNEDHKVWLTDGRVLKRMINFVKEGKTELSAEDIKTIKDIYSEDYNAYDVGDYYQSDYRRSNISSVGFWGSIPNIDGDTVVSKTLLDNIMGIKYNMTSKDWDPKYINNTIKEAYKYVQDNINALDMNQQVSRNLVNENTDYRFIFEPSDATSLWIILGATDGKITLEDLDRLYSLEAEAYNEFFEKLNIKGLNGADVKAKVDSLYERLMKHIIGENTGPRVRISGDKKVFAQTGTATNFMDNKNILVKAPLSGKKLLQAINPEQSVSLKRIENPALSEQAVVDALVRNTERFANDYRSEVPATLVDPVTGESTTVMHDKTSSDYARDDSSYYTQIFSRQIAKDNKLINRDLTSRGAIIDISANINLAKMVSTSVNTQNALVKALKLDLSDNLYASRVKDYIASLVRTTSGIRYTSNYKKFSFFNPDKGTEYESANMTKADGKRTHVDLLNTMLGHENKDFVGKVFINLDKHNADNPDGLTFAYRKFDTEADVRNFKNEVILKVLKENEWRLNSVQGSDFFTKLSNLNSKQLQSLMNKIITDTITEKDKVDNALEALSKTNIGDAWRALILPPDFSAGSNKYTIEEMLGRARRARDADNEQVRMVASAILYGIDYKLLDPKHRELVDVIKEDILASFKPDNPEMSAKLDFTKYNISKILEMEEKFKKGVNIEQKDLDHYRNLYGLNSKSTTEDYVEAIKKYIYNHFENPEVLDYLFNKKVPLMARFRNWTQGFNETYKVTTSDGESTIAVEELNKFFNGTGSTLHHVKAMDLESGNLNPNLKDISNVFQIAIKTYKVVNGKLTEEIKTYFIDHQLSFKDNTKYASSEEKWIDEHVDTRGKFYLQNEAYRKALEDYKDHVGNFITKEELAVLLKDTEDVDMYIAYNGNNFEFEILKDYLDPKAMKLDAIETVLKREANTTISIGQEEEYKRTFSMEHYKEAHTAEEDTEDMMELLRDHFSNTKNMVDDRNKLIIDIHKLLPEDLTDAQIAKIYNAVDKALYTKNLSETRKSFKSYNPTLDNIKKIQRAMNYLKNNTRGSVWMRLMDQLGYNSNSYVKMIVDSNMKYNIIDAIAIESYNTKGDFIKAFDNLYYSYIKQSGDNSLNSFLEKLANKDAETYKILNINSSMLDEDEVKTYRSNLINQLSTGTVGFRKGKINGISESVATEFVRTRPYIPYLMEIQDMCIKNKQQFSKAAMEVFRNMFINNAISIEEGYDESILSDYEERNIYFDDSGVESLALEIKNLLGKNKGTGTFVGLYSMMDSVSPFTNEYIEVDMTTNKAKGKLKNVSTGDIVITRAALKKFFNVYDVETMKASDGNYYLMSITYPADNMNPILPLRVRLIEGDEITIRFTPETQEILRNRDFDGDHTMTTVLSPDAHKDANGNIVNNGMLEMAPVIYRIMWEPTNLYTKSQARLNKINNNFLTEMGEVVRLGTSENILALSKELDVILSKIQNEAEIPTNVAKEIKALEDLMASEIETVYNNNGLALILGHTTEEEKAQFIKDSVKALSVKETFTNMSHPIRYVNNPALYSNSYTYKARKAMFSRLELTKSNILDPTVGTYQKVISYLLGPNKVLNDPIQDLYTPSMYLTKSMSAMINDTVDSQETLVKFVNDLTANLSKMVNSNKYNDKSIQEYKQDYLVNFYKWATNTDEFISKIANDKDKPKAYAQFAETVLSQALHDLELFSRNYNNFNDDLKAALDRALDLVTKDTTFSDQLERTKLLDEKLAQLTHRKKSISGYAANDTPLSDMLQSELVRSKVSTNLNKPLAVTTSDKLDEVSEGTFNFAKAMEAIQGSMVETVDDDYSPRQNKVNVFVTKGIFNNEDTVGLNTNIGKRKSRIRNLTAKVMPYEGITFVKEKVNKQYVDKVREGAVIKEGETIGFTENGTRVYAKGNMVISNISKKDNAIIYFEESEVVGKKLAGSGFFKGNTAETRIFDIDKNSKGFRAQDVDLIVDANNATKNWNKYAQGIELLEYFKDSEYVSYKGPDGRVVQGYILKNVPTNIIGADIDYTPKLDPNDPSHIRSFELMSMSNILSFMQTARFGSAALKHDKEGRLYIDTSYISEVLDTNKGDHRVSWGDTGSYVMFLRTDALLNSLTDKEIEGLFGSYNSPFKTKEEYLNNIRYSREKINSYELLEEQYAMMRALGRDRMIKLANSSNVMKFLFSNEIANKLDPTMPSNFSDEFYSNPKSTSSRASGGAEAQILDPKYESVHGRLFNMANKSTNDRTLVQNTVLHVPFIEFYRGVTGSYPNTNAILKAIQEGDMGYRQFIPNSASIGTEWTSIDTKMGSIIYDPILNEYVFGGNTKTNLGGEQDIFGIRPRYDNLFLKGSDDYDVFETDNTPTKPTFESLIGKSIDNERLSTGYAPSVRAFYIMALAMDKNKNSVEKAAEYRGIKGIEVNKLVGQFVNDEGGLNYQRVHQHSVIDPRDYRREINKGTKGYMLRRDITDTISKQQFTDDEVKAFNKSKAIDNAIMDTKQFEEAKQREFEAYEELTKKVRAYTADKSSGFINFTWDLSTNDKLFESRLWTRSGISTDNADQLGVDIGIKNFKAEAEYIQLEYGQKLTALNKLITKSGIGNFEQFAKYRWLTEAAKDPKTFESKLKYMGLSKEEWVAGNSGLKTDHDAYVAKYPEVVKAYDDFISNMMYLAGRASQISNEPFDSFHILMAPYVPKDKVARENIVLNNLKKISSISKAYDPSSNKNIVEQNMIFNFFEGSEKLIRDMSNVIAAENISNALTGKYTGKALINNVDIVNKAFEIIDAPETFGDLKIYNSLDSEITDKVLEITSMYTDLDIYRLRKTSKNGADLILGAYREVRGKAEALRQQLAETSSDGVVSSLSEIYRMANVDQYINEPTRLLAKETYNAMWAQLMIAQRIIECSSRSSDKLVKYIAGLEKEGYSLVNKFGQKIQRGGSVAPIFDGSLSYLKDNIELSYNSKSDTMFAQYVLEKALSGEIYLARNDLVDQLSSKVYTRKIPGRLLKLFKKISTTSAGIQMALPAKMLSRFLRYTGSDYAMGAISNYDTIPNIARAGKDISQALSSKGKSIPEDLKDYLIREGQPSLWGGTNKDPINFTEDMGTDVLSKVTDFMTKPLDLQNHLGRYAIYLTAKDSFDNGRPWYGSQYYNKNAIDGIKDNRDKAMYVMDYMLGSPGGFPYLSKYTSGIMMFATFPMNLTRTLGSYGMSVARLFQEGITENNATQWYNTVVMPSLGMIGLSLLSNAIITAVCDTYGVDEETEEEWIEDGVTLDPIGTLIGGTPTVVYDSLNPAYQIKEMYINPLTNEYNDTIAKKGYGWMKANVLSRLNPALKLPIEIVTGQEMFGDSGDPYQIADPLMNTKQKYQYTNVENGMRKVLGFFTGSGIADNVIDQNKYAQYSDQDTGFLTSIWKGLTKGINSDLGNQKSWKKDTSNYYAFITDMKAFSRGIKGYDYDLDINDMASADELYYNRHYASQYGSYDVDDFNRVNQTLRKMINDRESSTVVYNYITHEYNDNDVSEATLRAALNNNSIIRKLNTLKEYRQAYINSLTPAEQIKLQQAIEYELEMYPMLEKLFPAETKDVYVPKYRKTYNNNYYGSGYSRYYPYTNIYPGKYYPKTYSYNKKLDRYGNWDLDRVSVNVSPEMGVWSNDYNLTSHDTGVDYEDRSDLEWLR